jgi:hypothetical protein
MPKIPLTDSFVHASERETFKYLYDKASIRVYPKTNENPAFTTIRFGDLTISVPDISAAKALLDKALNNVEYI